MTYGRILGPAFVMHRKPKRDRSVPKEALDVICRLDWLQAPNAKRREMLEAAGLGRLRLSDNLQRRAVIRRTVLLSNARNDLPVPDWLWDEIGRPGWDTAHLIPTAADPRQP